MELRRAVSPLHLMQKIVGGEVRPSHADVSQSDSYRCRNLELVKGPDLSFQCSYDAQSSRVSWGVIKKIGGYCCSRLHNTAMNVVNNGRRNKRWWDDHYVDGVAHFPKELRSAEEVLAQELNAAYCSMQTTGRVRRYKRLHS